MKKRKSRNHHNKSISHETLLGQKGMNMAERVILDMGFVWNQIHIESGIDAVIEIRDPATGVTKNRIIQAQVKAVSHFAAEQGDAFSFACERAHIGYWLGGTARVILIVCKPDSEEIYWKDLYAYFSLPENRERCTVRFSKTTDQFNVTVRSKLLTVAKPEGGLALGPLPKREILGINLLPLRGYPKDILETATKAKARNEFFDALKAAKKPWLQEFIWENGTLYSFFDPVAEGLSDLCNGTPKGFPTHTWSESTDPVLQRHFADLLARAFEHRCYKQGVIFDRESRVFYFTAPPDGSEKRITTKSLVNTTAKTVVSKHPSLRQDGTPSMYYKHHAFEGRMRRFANEWFFELTPTFYFTQDGKASLPNAELLLSGIKRMERHAAVLGEFLTWKEFLTDNTLFNFRYRFLTILSPEALPIDRGIDDRAWKPLSGADVAGELAEEEDTAELAHEEEGDLFSWKHF
jgi:hypothetical protein